jgi:tuberous sclerosis protein 2
VHLLDSVLTGSETLSPTAPGTPTTPDSPEDPETAGSSRKIPVRRSNSSPEMSSTWKPPHLNLQKDIQEQDEEELTISIKHADEPGSTSCTSIFSGPLSSESSVNKNGSSKSSFAPIPTEYNPVSTESNMPTNTSPPQAKSSSKDDSGSSYTASSNPTPIKGNTSPFRRSYDAIPEESVQKTGSLGSSPEGKSQVEVIVPMKRDRMATISVNSVFHWKSH